MKSPRHTRPKPRFPPTFTREDVRRTFKELALSLHPDKATGNSAEFRFLYDEYAAALKLLDTKKDGSKEDSCEEEDASEEEDTSGEKPKFPGDGAVYE